MERRENKRISTSEWMNIDHIYYGIRPNLTRKKALIPCNDLDVSQEHYPRHREHTE
jgi:hypothetical protein